MHTFTFSGTFEFPEFCFLMAAAVREDLEMDYKERCHLQYFNFNLLMLCLRDCILQETFRVFSKDSEGCIPAEEIK